MILKIKIQNKKLDKKNKTISVWIQKKKEIKDDLIQLFEFFKINIQVSERIRLHKYYKITSKSPAILLSLVSTINELIPEIYFKSENTIEEEVLVNVENV